MEINYLQKLAQLGYSIIPCREDKRPLGSWKQYQESHRNIDEVEKLNSPLFGLVTGYNNVEVIDVDLKVFSSLKEQNEFWDEYINLLRDNIDEFDSKFVIKKTKNKGYHIIYKCDNPVGNSKISKLKNHDAYIIESRGIGGMVILYDQSVNDLNYHDIQMITNEDRDILWSCSRLYDYKYETNINPDESTAKSVKKSNNEVLALEDFDNKTNIWDVISDEFTIVANLKDMYVIKRYGAKSAHSGYIYKDKNAMYLFSTGTRYKHETLIGASAAYTQKYHNGDFKAASLDLYIKGYGTRSKEKIKEIEKEVPKINDILEEYNINKDDLEFPIDIFPETIQSYIMECHHKLDSNIDFMGSSLLWTISLIIGNSLQVEVKNGWNESASIWIAVVGRAGLGKTPSINNIIHPLEKINSREIKRYLKEYEKYAEYESLTKKEKEDYPEVKKPKKTQFIANDITIEALVDLHQESTNAVGVFKDELAGWLKDMNKYRAGSDLEFWLSSWSGKSVNLNRLTRAGSFVERPFIPVLGGIQPDIFNTFYTDENKDNGFMDRMLLSFPDSKVEEYNENELSEEILQWYKETIIYIYDQVKSLIVYDDEGEIDPQLCKMNKEAKAEWSRIFNDITRLQNNESENEYLKSMYPKQKSYIPRFALLLNVFNSFFDDDAYALEITKETMLKAERLSKYFIANAKKIKVDNIEKADIKQVTKKLDNNTDKVRAIYDKDKNFNRTKVAEVLGVSVQQIRRIVKSLEHH